MSRSRPSEFCEKLKPPKLDISKFPDHGSYNFRLSLVGAFICGPAMAVSKNSYVWAAPMKPQMPTVQVQNAASAPTYAWGRQPAPVLVSRQTTRVMVRPLPPAPVVVARRTIRVVVKPAQVVVRAAAPPQLPRLLGSPRKASTAHPVKGPKAGVGEPAPHVTAVEDAKPGPHDVTAPNEVTETGNTEAVLEASAPVFELVHPKGRPVSYGPARPFLILKAEEDCPQLETDVPNEPAPKPAPEPAPEPAPPAEEIPGEAEALEALKALMAELGRMGFKVPQKPTGEPEAAGRVQGKLTKIAQSTQNPPV